MKTLAHITRNAIATSQAERNSPTPNTVWVIKLRRRAVVGFGVFEAAMPAPRSGLQHEERRDDGDDAEEHRRQERRLARSARGPTIASSTIAKTTPMA